MNEFEFTSKKVRVWIGELPDLNCRWTDMAEQVVAARPSLVREQRRAAIELRRYLDGPSSYGLLGAEFTPTPGDQLTMRVSISAGNRERLAGSLADKVDEVWLGLPYEYTEAIIGGALSAAEMLGSGSLKFACGAYGEASSSPRFLGQLAGIVVKLLSFEQQSVSREEVDAVLQFGR